MKKLTTSLLGIILFASTALAQSDIKPLSFGFGFGLNDFKTASYIRQNSLAAAMKDGYFKKIKQMDPAMYITLQKGILSHLDLAGTLSAGFVRYPVPNKVINSSSSSLLLEGTFTAVAKLLKDKYLFNPYLTAGVGASKYRGYFAAIAPVGAGLQIKATDDVFFRIESQYRIPVSANAEYHFFHSIGVLKSLKMPAAEPIVATPPVPVVLDRDGDGVNDDVDKCPDTPGLAALNGCPDRDSDGIADGDDKCPDVAGLARYQGCPIPDSDGDGINDEEDKCPNVKGVARYQGCPIPDSDNDGVNDEEDKCPNRPGPVSNQGCPEISKTVIEKINYAAKNVFFATGSAKLMTKSFKPLNEVVALLKADESLMLDIDGHTDSQGADAMNQTLSEKRAAAVKDYLVSKGISESRLKATGYGETKPVADNATAAGRAKNRRTEMTARNF